jgi:hypothetical protein
MLDRTAVEYVGFMCGICLDSMCATWDQTTLCPWSGERTLEMGSGLESMSRAMSCTWGHYSGEIRQLTEATCNQIPLSWECLRMHIKL